VGDQVNVTAAIFSDGHDHVNARLLYKHESDAEWQVARMTALPNDLWSAGFHRRPSSARGVLGSRVGSTHFDTWCADLTKRLAAQPDPTDPTKRDLPPQDIPLALRTGALLLEEAAARAGGPGQNDLRAAARNRYANWPT